MKKISYSILFLTILLLFITLAGYLLRPRNTDVCMKQIDNFHSIKENSLDVIVFGSSHSWFGFDANKFSELTGYSTYNYSDYWQRFNTTWAFFHDSLETQKPQYIFIDTGRIYEYLDLGILEGQSYYCRKLHNNKYKIKFFMQCFRKNKEAYLSYFVPLIAFHNNWNSDVIKKIDDEYTDFVSSRGQYVSYNYSPIEKELVGKKFGSDEEENELLLQINEYLCSEREQTKIPENCLELMEDISKTCKENGIQIIWFTTPFVGNFMYSEALSEYAKEHDETYVNLFDHLDELALDYDNDFVDVEHLNANGAEKLSEFMAKYINLSK